MLKLSFGSLLKEKVVSLIDTLFDGGVLVIIYIYLPELEWSKKAYFNAL